MIARAFLLFLFTAPAWAEVTFTKDIAPLVQAHCVECHRPGEAGPFSLVSYAEVSKRSKTILRVAQDHYMPPWHAVGGDVPMKGERRLTDAQIQLLQSWVDQGTPEGDPRDLPPMPTFESGWKLGQPDLVLEMDRAYDLPADGPDIYRHFVLKTGLKESRWLKAIAFKAGSAEVVHHSLFYLDTSGAARQEDDKDDEAGFAEMPLGAGIGAFLGGWVPGSTAIPLPDGLAYRVPANADIILQTHFHLTGKPESEKSRIGLYFGKDAPERPFMGLQLPPLFGVFSLIQISPGDPQSSLTDESVLPVAVQAFGVTAHAHYLGKSLKLTAKFPDGREMILLNVPHWDFAWQEEYRFQDVVPLPAGTRLTSVISWDNSPDNPGNPTVPPVRVHWGRQSHDEMGSVTLLLSTKNQKEFQRLRSSYHEHLNWQASRHLVSPEKLKFAHGLREKAMKRFDRDGDGQLNAQERAAAQAFLDAPVESQ